jgi:hypothetical protein
MNKKLYLYRLVFSSFFIFILCDLMGYIKNLEIGFYLFFSIIFILHGLITLQVITLLQGKLYMFKNLIKKIFIKINNFFTSKNKKDKVLPKKTTPKNSTKNKSHSSNINLSSKKTTPKKSIKKIR